jgi:AcrR family transcriptional regulator
VCTAKVIPGTQRISKSVPLSTKRFLGTLEKSKQLDADDSTSKMSSTTTSKTEAEDTLPRVTPGVFFGGAAVLPRGPHALPREAVLAEQRERLMAAVTELIAAGGYALVKIGSLAGRAKISRTAFYECFPSKEACAYAAYERFTEVLLRSLAEGAASAQRGGATLDMADVLLSIQYAYFGALEQDLVATRAFLVEFDAVTLEARERRRVAIKGIAAYLRQIHAELSESDPTLAPVFDEDVYLGLTYMIRQLACDALDKHARPNLHAIADTLTPWLLTSYRPGFALAGPQALAESPRMASG